jgi:PKD repeat protein
MGRAMLLLMLVMSVVFVVGQYTIAPVVYAWYDPTYVLPPLGEIVGLKISEMPSINMTSSLRAEVAVYGFQNFDAAVGLCLLRGSWDCAWGWGSVRQYSATQIQVAKAGEGFTAIGIPLWLGTAQWIQSIDIYGFGQICILALKPPKIREVREDWIYARTLRLSIYVDSPGQRGSFMARIYHGEREVYYVYKGLELNVGITACHTLMINIGPVTFLKDGVYTLRVEYSSDMGRDAMKKSVRVGAPEEAVLLYVTNVTVPVGGTGSIKIILDKAPGGLSGYSLKLTTGLLHLCLPGCAEVEITGVKFPDWAGLSDWRRIDKYTVELKAVDIRDIIKPGAQNVVLAEITVRGVAPGVVFTNVFNATLDDDSGRPVAVVIKRGVVYVSGCPRPVAGVVPRDLDGDGLYEDLNGNGRLDYDDVVRLFRHFDDPSIRECWQLYDFNRNGRLDYNDVVTLFKKVP